MQAVKNKSDYNLKSQRSYSPVSQKFLSMVSEVKTSRSGDQSKLA